VSRPTWVLNWEPHPFRLQAFHLLWIVIPDASAMNTVSDSLVLRHKNHAESHDPGRTTDAAFNVPTGLGFSLFARRY
jgi:hypothetical protein